MEIRLSDAVPTSLQAGEITAFRLCLHPQPWLDSVPLRPTLPPTYLDVLIAASPLSKQSNYIGTGTNNTSRKNRWVISLSAGPPQSPDPNQTSGHIPCPSPSHSRTSKEAGPRSMAGPEKKLGHVPISLGSPLPWCSSHRSASRSETFLQAVSHSCHTLNSVPPRPTLLPNPMHLNTL